MSDSSTRWLSALPDALLAALFSLVAAQQLSNGALFAPTEAIGSLLPSMYDPLLSTIVMIEALFLIPQMTLVDIATRLRSRPPWWLLPPLTVIALLVAPGGLEAAQTILANQAWLAIPAAWSLWHRGRLLWTMPVASDLQRMQTRAEFAGRLTAGLTAAAALVLSFVATWAWLQDFNASIGLGERLLPAAVAVYFWLCVIDILRIHGARFEAQPSALFGWDTLGIKNRDRLL